MNSTRVTGGAPPAPLHGPVPLPHSPVRQVAAQNVRAQILPDQGAGMSMGFEALEASSKPVVDGCDPVPVRAAGQIVFGQLFTIVNFAASPPANRAMLRSVKYIIISDIFN